MKNIIYGLLACCACMLTCPATAQDATARVYLSVDSLLSGYAVIWDDVRGQKVGDGLVFFRRGNDYKFVSSGREHRKMMKSREVAVEFLDSLYVSGSIFGMKTTYLYAERLGDRLLVVSSRPIQDAWWETNEVEWLGETFRLIGGMVPWIVASFDGGYRYYFYADLASREMRALNNREQMVRLLAPYPDLVTRYRLEGGLQTSRAIAPFIDEYLRRERGRR